MEWMARFCNVLLVNVTPQMRAFAESEMKWETVSGKPLSVKEEFLRSCTWMNLILGLESQCFIGTTLPGCHPNGSTTYWCKIGCTFCVINASLTARII